MPDRLPRAQLDSYQPPAPRDDLVDRIMQAVGEERARGADRGVARPARRRPQLGAIAAGLALAAILVGLLLWLTRTKPAPDQGWLAIRSARSTQELALGGRAVAVVHEGASLRWQIIGEEVSAVQQTDGVVVYSVNKGGPFDVRVPGGRVQVLGTRFQVEVRPMSRRARRATVGAAALAVAIVAVYQGRVLLSSSEGEVALAAGEVGSLRPGAPPRRHAGTPAAERVRERTGWASRFASRQARRKLLQLVRAARARRTGIGQPGAAASTGPAAGQPTGGAEAPSGSLPKEYIQATIKEALPLVKECYELALHEDPNLQGKLIAKFTIAGEEEAGGLVELVDIEGQDPVARHPTLAECIRETIYSLEFPRPEGGGRVKVSYPFKLRSSRSSRPEPPAPRP